MIYIHKRIMNISFGMPAVASYCSICTVSWHCHGRVSSCKSPSIAILEATPPACTYIHITKGALTRKLPRWSDAKNLGTSFIQWHMCLVKLHLMWPGSHRVRLCRNSSTKDLSGLLCARPTDLKDGEAKRCSMRDHWNVYTSYRVSYVCPSSVGFKWANSNILIQQY